MTSSPAISSTTRARRPCAVMPRICNTELSANTAEEVHAPPDFKLTPKHPTRSRASASEPHLRVRSRIAPRVTFDHPEARAALWLPVRLRRLGCGSRRKRRQHHRAAAGPHGCQPERVQRAPNLTRKTRLSSRPAHAALPPKAQGPGSSLTFSQGPRAVGRHGKQAQRAPMAQARALPAEGTNWCAPS